MSKKKKVQIETKILPTTVSKQKSAIKKNKKKKQSTAFLNIKNKNNFKNNIAKSKNKQHIHHNSKFKFNNKQNNKDCVTSQSNNLENIKSAVNSKSKRKNKRNICSSATEEKDNKVRKLNIQKITAMLKMKDQELLRESKKNIENSLTLRERMLNHLKGSRFRFLNEQLYSSESSQSKKYFEDDPQAFYAYHEGYKQQVKQWPMNPLNIIIESIQKMPKDHVIADFGCGEAKLADSVSQTVHSLDFVAVNDKVKACDMAHTNLLTGRINVAVFCLSLMGSNLGDYILEANRVLCINGILKIAEVESRFDKIEHFINLMLQYGFVNTWKDLTNNLFYFMDFKKTKDVLKKNVKKLPVITLKSCLYKKR